MSTIARTISTFAKREMLGKSNPNLGYDALGSFPIRTRADAEAFLKGLKCREWRVVLGCLQNIGRWASYPEIYVEPVALLLRHTESSIQGEAAKVLGTFGEHSNSVVPQLESALHSTDLLVAREIVFSLCAIPAGRKSAHRAFLEYIDGSQGGQEWAGDHLVRPNQYEPYGVGSLNVQLLDRAVFLLTLLDEFQESTMEKANHWFNAPTWGPKEMPIQVQTSLCNLFVAFGCEGQQDALIRYLKKMLDDRQERYVKSKALQLLQLHPQAWTEGRLEVIKGLIG